MNAASRRLLRRRLGGLDRAEEVGEKIGAGDSAVEDLFDLAGAFGAERDGAGLPLRNQGLSGREAGGGQSPGDFSLRESLAFSEVGEGHGGA